MPRKKKVEEVDPYTEVVIVQRQKMALKGQLHCLNILAVWIRRYITSDFIPEVATGEKYQFRTKTALDAVRIERLLEEVADKGFPSRHNYE
jgi:hypothetical protein